MNLNSILKFCSRHRVTFTLSVILFTSGICSVFFVQAVFGQTTFRQMFETIKFSEVFSTSENESVDSGKAEVTGLLTEKQPSDAPSTAHIIQTPPGLTPSPSEETAELTLTSSPAQTTEAPIPTSSMTTQSDKNTTSSAAAATTAKAAAAAATNAKATAAAATTAKAAAAAATTAKATAAAPAATVKAPAATQPAAASTAAATAATTAATTATTAAATAATTAAGSLDTSKAYAVLDLSNQQRASALAWSDTLAGIAQTRAKELSISFSHTRPDGSSCWMSDCQLAENIARGQSSASDVVASWMNSSAHAANITNAGYTQMGVGCYYSNGVYYWAQEFG